MSVPPPCPHCGESSSFADGFTCESCGRSWVEMELSKAIIIPAGELTAKHTGRTVEFNPTFPGKLSQINHDFGESVLTLTRGIGYSEYHLGHDTPVTILPEEADNG